MILRIRREFHSFISAFSQRESFSRNFSYAFGGKVIIIIFTFLTTPLLTRLYSPEAYGYFAFMNTIATNVAMVATLGYPTALIIARRDRDFYNLFASVFFISIFCVLMASGVFICYVDEILPFDLGPGKWWYVALTLFASLIFALTQIFPKWNVRRNEFKTGAKINVFVHGIARAISLTLGFVVAGNSFGLMIGDIAGKVFGIAANSLSNVRKEWRSMISQVRLRRMLRTMIRFKRYPYFILTGSYVAILSTHIPLLAFSYRFEAAAFGNYSLAAGMVAIPGILLATPVASVLLKKVATLHEDNLHAIPAFLKRIVYGLFFSALFPFAIVVVFGPEIFALIFGVEWVFAGNVASILAVFGVIEILQIAIQNIFQVYKLEKLIFRYNLIQLILVVIFILPGLSYQDPILMIWGFSIAKTFSAFLVLARVLVLCRIDYKVVIFRFVFIFVSVVGLLMGLKKGMGLTW